MPNNSHEPLPERSPDQPCSVQCRLRLTPVLSLPTAFLGVPGWAGVFGFRSAPYVVVPAFLTSLLPGCLRL